ncbi:MAG: N-acetylmuramoyl-L-alanine amidase [Synergistales bacterium]
MSRLRVPEFLLGLLAILFSVAPAWSSETGWTLWKNNGIAGVVSVRSEGSTDRVGLKGMAAVLGCEATVKGDRLIVTNGKRKLEFVLGAAAAKTGGGQLVPLAAAVLAEEGEWWAEQRGTLRLFEELLSGGTGAVKLRFAGTAPLPEKAETPPAPSAPQPVRVAVETPPAVYGPLPRIEGIRWSRTAERIRAVLDLSAPLEPSVRKLSGEVELTLAAAASRSIGGVPSPYAGEVSVAITQFGDKTVVRFQYRAGSVKSFSLHKPERYVLDFQSGGGEPEAPQSPASVEPVQDPKPATPFSPVAMPPVSPGKRPDGKPFLVVVDAGHGGHDPGAVSGGIREKEVNLRAAARLVALLRETGLEARLTRKDDTYLRLNERTDLANGWNADLFVSLHCNALPSGRHARGVEIYLMALPTDKDAMRLALYENRELGKNNTVQDADAKTNLLLKILGDMEQNAKIGQSTRLAESLFGSGRNTGLPMSRVAQAPFFVLRGAAMPAVLVEMGYLTEPEDRRLLNDPAFMDRLLRSLVSGMSAYLKTLAR